MCIQTLFPVIVPLQGETTNCSKQGTALHRILVLIWESDGASMQNQQKRANQEQHLFAPFAFNIRVIKESRIQHAQPTLILWTVFWLDLDYCSGLTIRKRMHKCAISKVYRVWCPLILLGICSGRAHTHTQTLFVGKFGRPVNSIITYIHIIIYVYILCISLSGGPILIGFAPGGDPVEMLSIVQRLSRLQPGWVNSGRLGA